MKSTITGLVALLCCLPLPAGVAAAAEKVALSAISQRAEYRVTLSGLPIADAWFDAVFEGDRYTISSRFYSSGIAQLLVEMHADTLSSGHLRDGRATPKSYVQDFRRGKGVRRYDVNFTRGNVTDFTIVPPRRAIPKNWVKVMPEHLKSVLDPLTAMLRPGNEAPCPARLPVFDGEMRFDLVFDLKGQADFSTKGFDGKAAVCSVRFEPKSGYRKGRQDVDYVRRLTGMEIWFARSAKLDAYAPVRLTVPTRYGELKVVATRFGN